jgi:CPA1 family monovalent cation:H+ antiporter
MSLPALVALLFTLTALLSALNARFLRLPPTIGVLLGGLMLAAAVAALGALGVAQAAGVRGLLLAVPFDRLVMEGLLSFLLFASAVQTDVGALLRERGIIAGLAVVTTLVTMLTLGGGLYLVTGWLGQPLTLAQALLFGAIVAPTDPVAVMPLLERAGVPERLRALVAGESLFNDGVGVAAFTVLSAAAVGGAAGTDGPLDVGRIGALLAREMLGGIVLGALLGVLTAQLTRLARDQATAVLLSLALVTGGYALGELLGVSAPVTVAAGGVTLILLLRIGRARRKEAGRLSLQEARDTARIRSFWEVLDQVLNAVLFVLLALEALVVNLRPELLGVGVIVAVLSVAARGLGVWLPLTLYQTQAQRAGPHKRQVLSARRLNLQPFAPYTRRLMTWAGLRGGVALALAFSLPAGELRDRLLFLTYVVVLFSLLGQGLTVPLLARRAVAADPGPGPSA